MKHDECTAGTMTDQRTIYRKSLASVKWNYGYTLLPKVVSPVVQIVLARLLVPADFGLIAIATLVIAFVEAIREAGFSQAFIQHTEDDDGLLFSTVFWMSTGTGVLLYIVIFLTAPLISKLFHNPDSLLVVRVMALQMILSSLNTCHSSSLIKRLEYMRLFRVNLLPTITPIVVTVPLAYGGFHVWALVTGYLASSLVRTIALWYYVPLKPLAEFDAALARRIVRFGSLCSLEAMLGWFYVWGDKAIVGHFLTANQLGLYTIAAMIALFVFDALFSPLSISYPLLCGLKDDAAAIRSVLYKLMHLVSSLSFLLAILVVFNVSFIPFLIGTKWSGIELPLAILAVTQSLSYIVTITIPDALKAINRPDIMPKLQSAKLLYTLPLFIAGAQYGGLVGFCYAKLVTVVIGFTLFLIIGVRVLGLRWNAIGIVLYPKIAASLITVAALLCLDTVMPGGLWIRTVSICLAAVAVYGVVCTITDRKGTIDLIRMARGVIRRRQYSA